MKRIIICADGTWSKPDRIDKEKGRKPQHGKSWVRKPSNVVKMSRAISPLSIDGVDQVVFYDPGVGTGWGVLDPIIGGAFGHGVSKNIIDCYRFLVQNYNKGDEIYLFGFSRGAFTVRSLAGLIHKCGLLEKSDAYYIPDAYEHYRLITDTEKIEKLLPKYTPKAIRKRIIARYQKENVANEKKIKLFCAGEYKHRNKKTIETKIKFIGVWDTVGSLGIPVSGLLGYWINHRDAFHNLRLGSSVDNAYQALAIDERRKPFTPTLWEPAEKPKQNMEQVWFVGVHTNVGGGYNDYNLENITFKWMVEKARAHDLEISEAYMEKIISSYKGVLRNSMTLFYRLFKENVRPIGKTKFGNESIHPSAIQRHEDPPEDQKPYAPENLTEAIS
ncbi:MAG: DUF2235 domain-containing protein [Anaerolineae bacterium]|jgi:uncharacterized protein (DUF2235 family)|nr:DUF2235 domain-containing protein [Anaerolineae bacterium]MBT7073176.1 DUF2235 domain-containing protein [Anaerolineae bacterium]MBT7324081.1 DUF2235 domain-containing protein [Anaerolineae bacterium]